jgi:hypothetical protein
MTNTRILESSSISFCKNPLETAPSSLCLGCSINKPREAALIVKWDADIMGIQGDISYGERDILYTYHYMCIYIYYALSLTTLLYTHSTSMISTTNTVPTPHDFSSLHQAARVLALCVAWDFGRGYPHPMESAGCQRMKYKNMHPGSQVWVKLVGGIIATFFCPIFPFLVRNPF